eukprot:TRINITY_DN3542_c0_g1_i1.p1 TRINITY_DN3542_c0_g1~~TRINITY_DN3542_c0_g1_i1.p1  ORF type:complete len:450 (-),score=123.70 TRINITY_DN3542_c0_g1_i1:139-1488(-)
MRAVKRSSSLLRSRKNASVVFSRPHSHSYHRLSTETSRRLHNSSKKIVRSKLNKLNKHEKRLYHTSNPSLASGTEKDYYKLLGVPRSATADEIKKAYRALVMKYHPDKNKGDKEAESKFAEINNAYSVLQDPKKRQTYDQFGAGAFDGSGGGGGFDPSTINMSDVNMHELFEDIFSSMGFTGGGRQRGKSKARGEDVELPLQITFMEAVRGTEKEVSFASKVSCPTCSGSGASPSSKMTTCKRCNGRGVETISEGFIPIKTECRSCGGEGSAPSDPCKPCRGTGTIAQTKKVNVKIPAGVDDGNKVRVMNQGDAGQKGAKAGHLFIVLTVKNDTNFKREQKDVHSDIKVPMTTACLGGQVEVDMLEGTKIEVKVAPGTQSGEKRILRGRGIPGLGSGANAEKGNHYIHFKVMTPEKLSQRQKELLEEFEKEEEKKGGSLFGRVKDLFGK